MADKADVSSKRRVHLWLWYGGTGLMAMAASSVALIATRGRNVDVRVVGPILAPLVVLVIARISGLSRRVQRTEAKLDEAEGRYRGLVEQIPAIVYTYEVDGGVRYVSPYIEAMYGFTPAEWLAQPELWLERMAPEDRERVVTQESHSRATGEPLSTEYRVRARDGRMVWVREDATVIDREGKPFLLQGVILDITVRREAEAAIERLNAELEQRVIDRTAELEGANRDLRQAKEAAERADRAKSEFLSRASHELRTPLNAILGFGQLLEGSALPPDDRESVEQILKGGRRLLALVNEVLDLSRIEAHRLSLSIEPVSVNEVVREALDLIRPLANERNVELRLGLPDSAVHVLADRERFKQVLLNLLSNAIKYNRDRDGTVSVSGQESPGRAYLIRVTDTGPGIPPEKIDRLFLPFDRIDTQTRVEGTGLGLALSKALTEAMGGRILVESLAGHGSTFSVEFPIGADAIPLSDSKVPPEDSLAAFPKGDQIILYVEDNMPNLALMERILTNRPRVKLVAAMQGRLGVELAREHCPDLVLLDLHLPDITGEAALQLLRNDPRTRDIPVIVTSAEADSDSIQRLLAAGADDYLTKPLDVNRFLELVDAYLTRPSDRLLARGTPAP